ncbi:hypothetical protein [Endozoicomonas sp. ONNA2]|uniref:hypothetical protein n=1 Tax=Endozoicomonas sp. ONNA2 TaxID=2828741 RepID=UPI0021495675|nr:hypothetical protein [Endozoicomonas sp. ONNA2]
MDKLNTALLFPRFHDLSISPESDNTAQGISKTEVTEKQIPDSSTGYFGRVSEKTIADRLHLHQMTKTDYKQTAKKRILFNQLIPSLMSATEMSQTSVLTYLLPALELTPYLRKMDRGEMVKVSDHPSQLQTGLLLELITRIKQGHKLHELHRLADGQPTPKEIKFNAQTRTLSIGLNHFTREDLGDETFRELRDRLLGQSDRREDPGVILDHVQKRKAVSMAHWQKILAMVLNIQDSATSQHITNALNTKHKLSPSSAQECEALTALIPTLKLTTHPGFSMMKPLFSWLSQHHLKGDKLNSQQLAWLKSMVTNKLYTQLPALEDTGLEELCIYKEGRLVSGDEAKNPREELIKKAIVDATPQELTEIVKLFDTLLCDLTPSVNAENRLGIIYTLLKFRGQSLLNNLLETASIGSDTLLAMYKAQLILTYSLDENAREAERTSSEQSVNCLLKTLQLRMARSIIMLATMDGLSVPPEVTNKARTLIDHHNDGLQAIAHEFNQQDTEDDNWEMDSCGGYSDDDYMPLANHTLSAENYLTLPDYLLTSDRAITLDPQHLMLPKDKHFRIPSVKDSHPKNRRSERKNRDEQKLRKDFLLTPQSTDLTRPIDWIKMEVPITCLFTGNTQNKNKMSFALQVFNTKVLPIIQQATTENTSAVSATGDFSATGTVLTISENVHKSLKRPFIDDSATEFIPRKVLKTEASSPVSAAVTLEELEAMNVIRELLALAEATGKPGLDLRAIITSIQGRTSNQTSRSVLQQLATVLPGLPDNHNRTQLLELTAFQLFAEFYPSDNAFKRLIKTLYIIRSRSDFLQFADDKYDSYGNSATNKLKLQMGELFRDEWRHPDGLLGSRIRQSVKAAFKQSDSSCSYQQIMDSVLTSMRPSNQPSDNYPHLINKLSKTVEKRMNQRRELSSLDQQQKILTAHHRSAYQGLLASEIKCLIKTASELCQQFLPEDSSSTKPMSYDVSRTDSDMAMSDQIDRTQFHTLPSRYYLCDQLKTLIPLIGNWLNQISDDGLIAEKDAAEAGIDRLVQFANSTIRLNRPVQNEDETLKQIIALCDRFHCLQQEHSQWQSTSEIASTHNQWVETGNTLKHLQYIGRFPSPQELQEQINKVIFGPEAPVLSPADQELLSTVSALRNRYEPELVSKALGHPDIREFSHRPEYLSHRIAEMNQVWSDSVRTQRRQYQSLESTLYHLQRDPRCRAPELEKRKAMHRTHERHNSRMDDLKNIQQKCQSHTLQDRSYPHDQPLLSTLESMAWGHTAKYSGIDTKPLNEQQKQQLMGLIESAPLENTLSDGTSLFDWIGMEENRQQLKAAANHPAPMLIDSPMRTDHQVFTLIKYLKKKNNYKIKELQHQIEGANKTLAEMEKGHNHRARELQEYKEVLFGLLGNRIHCKIMIDDESYSYADALIAFHNKDNYYYLKNVSSKQKEATLELYECTQDQHADHKKYQNDVQWLEFAGECRSHNTNPDILPEVINLMALERLERIDDIENKIVRLQQQIQAAKQTIAENSALIEAAAAQLEASLKPELDAESKKTREAELELFTKAFEHGQQLSESRAIQRVLCQYLRDNMAADSVSARIVKDCAAQRKHVPSNFLDIIEYPGHDTGGGNFRWLPTGKLPFQIINVRGAFPLLESLHNEGRMFPWDLLTQDDKGKPSSALVFAAAKRRYRTCKTLLTCLQEFRHLDLDTLNQLLTANPSGDNRNLLHLLGQLAKPATLQALLQLLNHVSKKQEFDADYPSDCLQNRIALDKEHLLKTLLAQTDYEGLYPTDLLLFNTAKKIREWPEDNVQALTSYCNDFLINEAKCMWIAASGSMGVEQSCRSVECFMKGIDDLDQLCPAKQQAAEDFLKQLMRIFRVHGPARLHEQLMAQITVGQAIGISDQHSFLSGSVS